MKYTVRARAEVEAPDEKAAVRAFQRLIADPTQPTPVRISHVDGTPVGPQGEAEVVRHMQSTSSGRIMVSDW